MPHIIPKMENFLHAKISLPLRSGCSKAIFYPSFPLSCILQQFHLFPAAGKPGCLISSYVVAGYLYCFFRC